MKKENPQAHRFGNVIIYPVRYSFILHNERRNKLPHRVNEHFIRDDNDLYNTREYILNNPLKWFFDEDNLKRDCSIWEYS